MSENNGVEKPATEEQANIEGSPTAELEKQLEKQKQDYLYLRAEFDTYKRNALKERSDLVKYGNERLVVELLNVLDNFERALETKVTPEQMENFVKGIKMTEKELRSVLQKFGVTEVPSESKAFDPSLHEALGSEESDAVEPGHIVRVFRKLYKLHDRVIRPAQVMVAKKPAE